MKTTFFGLTSFRNSLSIQAQALKLVEQSGFPVVMGFEFYPVVIATEKTMDPQSRERLQKFKARGFEAIEGEDFEGATTHLHTPGQLVIRPLVPIQSLRISLQDLREILKSTMIQWLQKYKIQAQIQTPSEQGVEISTSTGVMAEIYWHERQGVARTWISIHVSSDLTWKNQPVDSLDLRGIHLDLKQAFEEWNLYFTNALLSAIPGVGGIN